MSVSLLQAMNTYLAGKNLLTGYAVKYYRWSDEDLAGAGNFVMMRMMGTSGMDNNLLQQPGMMIVLVVGPAAVTAGNSAALAIIQALRGTDAPTGMVKVTPMGTVQGPFYLDNGRAAFQINVRCFVTNH